MQRLRNSLTSPEHVILHMPSRKWFNSRRLNSVCPVGQANTDDQSLVRTHNSIDINKKGRINEIVNKKPTGIVNENFDGRTKGSISDQLQDGSRRSMDKLLFGVSSRNIKDRLMPHSERRKSNKIEDISHRKTNNSETNKLRETASLNVKLFQADVKDVRNQETQISSSWYY